MKQDKNKKQNTIQHMTYNDQTVPHTHTVSKQKTTSQ